MTVATPIETVPTRGKRIGSALVGARIVDGISVAPTPPARPGVSVLLAQADGEAEALLSRVLDMHPGASAFVSPSRAVLIARTGPGLPGAPLRGDSTP
jgi:hypothetical protein